MITNLKIDDKFLSDKRALVEMSGLKMDPDILTSDIEVKERHYNRPQLKNLMIMANKTTIIWGRGTGKSEGAIAPRIQRNVDVMPRSHGVVIGSTYVQLIERTLPPVIAGWERMGMKRGVDFWFREKPPRHIPTPVIGPLNSDHSIFFKNGTVISMVSQDRPGSANGKTVHWIIGDEAKYLNKYKIDTELLPTNRGGDQYFGDIPEFHGILWASDMPTWKEAHWLIEQEKEMDKDRIDLILAIQLEIFKLWQHYAVADGKAQTAIFNRIQKLNKDYDALRMYANYYSEASTWDNVEGFGLKQLRDLKRTLPDYLYRTSILNERPFLTSEAFYPDLSQEKHVYTAINYSYVDRVNEKGEYAVDCRKDADLDLDFPIHVALDYGAHINTVEVGQVIGNNLKYLNALEVTHPMKLRDLAKKLLHYYENHAYKVMVYYYDHTAIAEDGKVDYSYAQEWISLIKAHPDWRIIPVYIGRTPDPKYRYELWGRLFRGEHPIIRQVGFNQENCNYTLESMRNAKLQKGNSYRQEFKKNKTDERNMDIDQRTTTHHSDSADTLAIGVCEFNPLPNNRYSEDAGSSMMLIST